MALMASLSRGGVAKRIQGSPHPCKMARPASPAVLQKFNNLLQHSFADVCSLFELAQSSYLLYLILSSFMKPKLSPPSLVD